MKIFHTVDKIEPYQHKNTTCKNQLVDGRPLVNTLYPCHILILPCPRQMTDGSCYDSALWRLYQACNILGKTKNTCPCKAVWNNSRNYNHVKNHGNILYQSATPDE